MNVLISGATGSFGSALIPALKADGHQVTRLTRSPLSEDDIGWDPLGGEIDTARLGAHDAVVHLAGETLTEVPWTSEKKVRIMNSRAAGTRLLSESIAKLSEPPGVMVSVSGVNYYGSRGNVLLREDSGLGNGFLSRVCREWEQGADPAREAGIRVVHPRFGIVFPQGFSLNLLGLEVGVSHPRFEISLGAGGRTLTRLPVFKLTGGGQAVLELEHHRRGGGCDPPRPDDRLSAGSG
jgi:uncharacterized protein (TIGR01777 family)